MNLTLDERNIEYRVYVKGGTSKLFLRTPPIRSFGLVDKTSETHSVKAVHHTVNSPLRSEANEDIVSRYAILRASTQKSETRDIHICLASSRRMLQVDVMETVNEPKNRVRRLRYYRRV